ncbi:MAG: Trk system potassium transporter TrkA [Candidatus Neomarinimicrobiota bacterium]
MKIVILGAGEVGFHVAKSLTKENHDITIMDIDPMKCKRASEQLDVIAVEGNGASPNNLIQARVHEADYVLCLTRVDEVNLIASQQAHELGAKKIIARLRNQQYSTKQSIIKPEKFGIDLVIHPEKEACREIIRLIKHSYATQVNEFEGGRIQMLGVRLSHNCFIVDKSVLEVSKSSDDFKFGIVAVLRSGKTIVPWGGFKFQKDDICYFIVKTENVSSLMAMLGIKANKTKSIIILGGSKIGRSLAEALQLEMNVRLIDNSREKAEWLATQMTETLILHGDGTDVELLNSENVQDADSFIAVTESEKTNLLSSLLAHHLGIKQTIIHISNTEFLPIVNEIGVGIALSKNMSTVNAILRFINSTISKTSITTFDEIEVDVLEFNPEPDSPVTKSDLNDLKFPEETIVGVINHHGHLSIARGTSRLTDEDTVLVFAKSKSIKKLRKLFSK